MPGRTIVLNGTSGPGKPGIAPELLWTRRSFHPLRTAPRPGADVRAAVR
ncbi:hypothetical protein HTV45_25545 [Streptomyces sp. CHD11]|nr:hypothetical protein [Streptomyces sp. CHD11]MBT3154195.1 hypothetical protein [Streptomyces sp. CHD11]